VTSVTTARAPGKLFVTGEWAVLCGAPAVVAAVDRHAEVRLEIEPGAGPLTIESLAEGRSTVAEAAAPLPGGDAGAVLAAVRAAAGPSGVRGRATVDTRPFLVGERKLGLGRSAATLAAAVAALLRTDDRDHVRETALAANAIFQDGRGSGADVAACVHGGLVEVRPRSGGPAVAERRLPAGLHLIAGWTGTAAPTTPLLDRFAALAAPPVAGELAAAAAEAADAVANGDADRLLELVDRLGGLLTRFGEETGMPIVTPALHRLMAAAGRVGAAAKPSGAGAGDCGIALATSAAQAAAVRAAWVDEGILPLPITLATDGVRLG